MLEQILTPELVGAAVTALIGAVLAKLGYDTTPMAKRAKRALQNEARDVLVRVARSIADDMVADESLKDVPDLGAFSRETVKSLAVTKLKERAPDAIKDVGRGITDQALGGLVTAAIKGR